ncbi:hypothetical protein SMC1_06395 [Candidatus Cryosericum septentrionale]|uniref:Secreted protein n=1 Tax=Candidatus Cryosericum septentrionale TaxID=2290913 RepID=A0A398DQT6_9BACT|nr:hypothetical protein SMC1_06395 [Candidatus Cryosericum septentrionale]
MKSRSARSAIVSSAACGCVTICLAATVPATVSTSFVRRSVSTSSSVPSVAEMPSAGSPTSASRPAGTAPSSFHVTSPIQSPWQPRLLLSASTASATCPFPAKVILSADLVTKDNAAKYYVPDSIY